VDVCLPMATVIEPEPGQAGLRCQVLRLRRRTRKDCQDRRSCRGIPDTCGPLLFRCRRRCWARSSLITPARIATACRRSAVWAGATTAAVTSLRSPACLRTGITMVPLVRFVVASP
jgi:hypothetical protein